MLLALKDKLEPLSGTDSNDGHDAKPNHQLSYCDAVPLDLTRVLKSFAVSLSELAIHEGKASLALGLI